MTIFSELPKNPFKQLKQKPLKQKNMKTFNTIILALVTLTFLCYAVTRPSSKQIRPLEVIERELEALDKEYGKLQLELELSDKQEEYEAYDSVFEEEAQQVSAILDELNYN